MSVAESVRRLMVRALDLDAVDPAPVAEQANHRLAGEVLDARRFEREPAQDRIEASTGDSVAGGCVGRKPQPAAVRRPGRRPASHRARLLEQRRQSEPLDRRHGAGLDLVRAGDLVGGGIGAPLDQRDPGPREREQPRGRAAGDARAGNGDVKRGPGGHGLSLGTGQRNG